MTTDERLRLLLNAPVDQLEKIDAVLERRIPAQGAEAIGPLLMGMSAAAALLNVSRGTLWRMIRAQRLTKIEILPGSYRLRRADLLALVNQTSPHKCHMSNRG